MSSPTTSPPATTAEQNAIIRMFVWWNEAFMDKAGYTAAAFRDHYTEDAELIVNGNLRGRGPEALAKHYRGLQEKFDHITMLLPVKDSFVSGDRAFVQCVTKAVKGETVVHEEAMACAKVTGGRMSRLVVIGRSMDEPK